MTREFMLKLDKLSHSYQTLRFIHILDSADEQGTLRTPDLVGSAVISANVTSRKEVSAEGLKAILHSEMERCGLPHVIREDDGILVFDTLVDKGGSVSFQPTVFVRVPGTHPSEIWRKSITSGKVGSISELLSRRREHGTEY